MKTLYHVRHPNGTSLDMLETQDKALTLARDEHAEVYELKGHVAVRIYSPPAMKQV